MVEVDMETACPDAEANALQVRDLPSYLGREHLVPSRQIVHVPIKKLTTGTSGFLTLEPRRNAHHWSPRCLCFARLVWFISLIWLVSFNQTNKTNQARTGTPDVSHSTFLMASSTRGLRRTLLA